MPVALEATNGLQRQGEPEEFLEEEELHFVEGKLLSELSTWGIGGPAKYFVELHTEPQLLTALRYSLIFFKTLNNGFLLTELMYFLIFFKILDHGFFSLLLFLYVIEKQYSFQ